MPKNTRSSELEKLLGLKRTDIYPERYYLPKPYITRLELDKLESLIASKVEEARIDELRHMKVDWGYGEYPLDDYRHGWDWEDYINHRLKALQSKEGDR